MKLVDILKWVGTGFLIVGTFINALGFFPLGPVLLIIGGCLWFTVGILWKEPAMIVTNSCMVLAGCVGLFISL